MELIFAVTNRLPEPALELLREAGEVRIDERETAVPRADLLELVAGADAVLTLLHDRVDEELLEAAGPQLRCVANVAVGYDNVDVAAAERRGVVVTNTPGVLDDATADLTMALILAATRRLVEGDRLVRSGRPWNWGMGVHARQRAAGQAARDRRPRRDRQAGGAAGARLRDGDRLPPAQPGAGRGRGGARGRAAAAGAAAGRGRRRSACTAR